MSTRFSLVRRYFGAAAVASSLSAPLSAQLAVGDHLNPGSNSLGYIDERIVDQTFTVGCATARLLPGFDPSTMPRFDPRNVTLSEATGCFHSGWTGTSIMSSAPRVLQSYTSVSVSDPSTLLSNGVNGVIALSRVVFLDAVYISSGAAVPDSVGFSFDLHGTLTSSLGANTVATPFANFGMDWDTDLAPGFTFTVAPSGSYYLAFAITPSMLDRWVPFSINLQTIAALFDEDPTKEFSGTDTTDYGHTLSVTKVDFVDGLGSGPGGDVTGTVDARFQSGTNYTAALPEPSSIVLMASGLVPVVALARRRRRPGSARNK